MPDTNTISFHARRAPDKVAVHMGGSGEWLTYAELEAASNRGAHLLRSAGLRAGDAVAICLDNSLKFFEVAWAAIRSGLVLVPVSTKLTAGEIAFIVQDCSAKALIVSESIGKAFADMPAAVPGTLLFGVEGHADGYRSWDEEVANQPASPVSGELPGSEMLYSSGTTGRPKGINYGQSGEAYRGVRDSALAMFQRLGLTDDVVYLNPAPLYHSAPFAWSVGTLQFGGTVVVMEKFDAEQALSLIERYKVTVSQWVPTHFVRMLKLPEEVRAEYDVSSIRFALHSAAPCPASVKREMIEWWGPVVYEYFGSSEQTALTFIGPDETLTHPGSVGRAVSGAVHICDEEGEPVPTGVVGQIYSEGGTDFTYHNDETKTRGARNRYGWTTVGDMGYLDEEGYLYLSDRKDFMIITGGVNVYPQEVENLLVTHPKITDAAVLGMPDKDYGQIVTAVIQPADMMLATPAFREELSAWMRQSLSAVKVPKRIEFLPELPRLPTGKMAKHKLRKELEAKATGQA